MSKKYLAKVKGEIKKWEEEGPGYLSQVSDMLFRPAQKIAESLIPEFVIDTVQTAIRGCFEALLSGASYTISKDEILQKIIEQDPCLDSFDAILNSENLDAMDAVAYHYWNWNLGYAITQGIATGSAELLGLAANIPALFTIIFRMMQQISASYGFDPDLQEEKQFILRVLSVASSADVAAKQAAMVFLKQLQTQLIKKTWKKLAEEKALSVAIRELAKTIGIQITKRKALQMVPIIGGIIGGGFDGTYANDVGRTAVMLYRKRKIELLKI